MLNAWKFLLDGQQVLASTSTQCLLQTTQKRHHPLIQYNKYNLHCSEKPTTNPYPYRPPLTNPQKPTHQTHEKKRSPIIQQPKPNIPTPLLIFFTQKETGRRIACHCPNLHSKDTASPHCFLCPRWPPSPEWHRCVPLRCVTCSRRSPFWRVIKRSGENPGWRGESMHLNLFGCFEVKWRYKFSNWDLFELWTNISYVTCHLQ